MQTDASISRSSCRVVVADDNRDVADSIALLLQLEGYQVTVVPDGTRALKAIEDLRPHIALLDIGLPGIDGYEVAMRVRQQPQLHVTLVAVTGWGQPADKARTLAAGFDFHYTKPVEPEVITNLCKEISARCS